MPATQAPAIRWTRKASCPQSVLAEPSFYRMYHDSYVAPTRRKCRYCGSLLSEQVGAWFVVPWRRDGRYVEHYRDAVRHFASQDRAEAYVRTTDDDALVVRWLDRWQVERYGNHNTEL